MMRTIAVAAILLFAGSLQAQTQPTTGLRENTPAVHALVNARIVTAPGRIIPSGTIVIRDGIIEAAGAGVQVPADARVWNMKGMTLYSGLIDLCSDYGMPKAPEAGAVPPPIPGTESAKGAAPWNPKARADVDAAEEFQPDPKVAEKLRAQGWTAVVATPQRGLFRGSGALVSLADGPGSAVVAKRKVAQSLSFDAAGIRPNDYPNSLMGVIAFIRQTLLDADWYRRAWESYAKRPDQPRPESNNMLAALQDAVQGTQPVVFDASDEVNLLRVASIMREFKLRGWIRGGGKEYRQLSEVRKTGYPLVVPVNFPDVPAVETPEDALNVSLADLRHWDAAPENPGRLAAAGIPIALTGSQLKDGSIFLTQVRKAVARGLSPDAALAALTTTPAAWLGVDTRYGSLEKGKAANIIVANGDLFSEKTKLVDVWVDGKRYEVKQASPVDTRGGWSMTSSANPGRIDSLLLRGETEHPAGTVKIGGREVRLSSVTLNAGRISFGFAGDSVGMKGTVRMSAAVSENELFGVGELPDGSSFTWKALRSTPPMPDVDTAAVRKPEMTRLPDLFPPGEYGRPAIPAQPSAVLVRHATVWTQSSQGILKDADLLIVKGKIANVGVNLAAPDGAVVVDAMGKHVTPGIIDCHSHTAAASINEGGQAVTCETRISDVLDPYDMSIYYQLAGGTTVANVLHGSANPIGGQNAVVKWRWGGSAEDLLLQGAMPGVKFALGENVKQTHWSQGRYPRTRMGVEQLIRDRFLAAQDYERQWKEWESNRSAIPPRRDLELDALVEIIHNKRLIHAHCYRQDEILALIRVAEEFGVKIATFQHVLEGYKVAEEIRAHGAGASGFTDWWAYKIEAFDAIPGNFPILYRQGVLVSYNSDDDELARRLNTEAAKALPFGISAQEALNFVTLNSARQLRIDDKVGSLERGKDGDFVIWSGDPLSTFSKCEQTWIDGRKYFDLQEDARMRGQIQAERAQLIQKVVAVRQANPQQPTAPPGRPPRFIGSHRRCEEVGDEH